MCLYIKEMWLCLSIKIRQPFFPQVVLLMRQLCQSPLFQPSGLLPAKLLHLLQLLVLPLPPGCLVLLTLLFPLDGGVLALDLLLSFLLPPQLSQLLSGVLRAPHC